MTNHLRDLLSLFDPSLPLDRARTIPARWYCDAELAAAERRVFAATWQAVGRIAQVAAAGAYLTADVAGEPVLVVRGDDGELRAFANVCRHRAARVAAEPCGTATRFRCPYHGWTYDLAGRLRGTPEFDGVADFRREDNGLVPLHAATWGPFVFVHGGASPPPLTDYLAPLPKLTAGLDLAALHFVARREYRLACNWKVFVDNYLDGGYHVNYVHPGLAGVLDYVEYRTEIGESASVQTSPLKAAQSEEAEGVGKVRGGDRAYYGWVFPNFMVNAYRGLMDTNLVLPLGPESCRVVFDFYFAETDGDAAARFIADSIAVADRIQHEDVGICEDVQRGLGSRTFDTGRYSVRREAPVYHFHRLLSSFLRAQ